MSFSRSHLNYLGHLPMDAVIFHAGGYQYNLLDIHILIMQVAHFLDLCSLLFLLQGCFYNRLSKGAWHISIWCGSQVAWYTE